MAYWGGLVNFLRYYGWGCCAFDGGFVFGVGRVFEVAILAVRPCLAEGLLPP
jgi:hypothetical protein